MSNLSKDKLIAALDVESKEKADLFIQMLSRYISTFKIGPVLFLKEGPEFIKSLSDAGLNVFLDMKFNDIPNIVEKAVRNACDLGIKFLTVHSSGGENMIRAAVNGANGRCSILAVTILTSFSNEEYEKTFGKSISIQSRITEWAKTAVSAGANGVVASPREITLLKSVLPDNAFIVTPGIRSKSDASDDQSRSDTAASAISNGATHIVVGRPLLNAIDPAKSIQEMLNEIDNAL